MKFDVERMCRMNGKKPTARERWWAFYRLWRLSHGRGGFHDLAAEEAFRVLFPSWRLMRMLEDGVSHPSRTHAPKFLRRQLLAYDRRQRLGYPDKARMQVVARKVREEHGIEVTPDEVAETRQKLIRLIRDKGLELGLPLPADDEELLRVLRACGAP